MLFLIKFKSKDSGGRDKAWQDYVSAQGRDTEVAERVRMDRQLKVVGKDIVYLIVDATSSAVLNNVLSNFEHSAEMEVTPVVELT